MPAACADLRGSLLLPGAGHWVQQERPEQVNAALLEFLAAARLSECNTTNRD